MTANDAPASIAAAPLLPPARHDDHATPVPPRPAALHPTAHRVTQTLLSSLGRRFRGATLTLEFELRTSTARRIFQRDFVYVSQQLHALEASRRVQGIDRLVLKHAQDTVGRHADLARTALMRCASDARSLVSQHGHASSDIEFARPMRLQATIVSPHARDYLEILGQADDALIQLEKAWLLGLLDAGAKSHRANDCRRALQGFKELVRQQRHVVGLHVRAVNAARRTALGLPAADVPDPDRRPGPSTGDAASPSSPPGDARAAFESVGSIGSVGSVEEVIAVAGPDTVDAQRAVDPPGEPDAVDAPAAPAAPDAPVAAGGSDAAAITATPPPDAVRPTAAFATWSAASLPAPSDEPRGALAEALASALAAARASASRTAPDA